MKRLITIIILAVGCVFGAFALTAEQVMAKVSAALTKPQSVSVTFSFSGSGGTGAGTMTMCRNRFTYNAGDLAVWYNGKQQWTLQRSVKEVSLTEPTSAELVESNPFSVISNYKTLYTATLLTAPKGYYKIELKAKSKAQSVRKAVITVSAATFVPTQISATMASGSTTVTIKSFSKGEALPKTYFEFDKRMNKNVELIDLR